MNAKRLGWFALAATLVLSVVAISAQNTRLVVANIHTLALLGTLYTTIALFFSILAALWARDARNIVTAYFKDFFALSEPERQLFAMLALATNGGGHRLTQEQFEVIAIDFRDAEWHLSRLTEKQWLERLPDGVAISESKRIIAQELQIGEAKHDR